MSALPSTRLKRVVRTVNAENAHNPGTPEDALLPQTCWRWEPEHNWPPFHAQRDVYAQDERCGLQSAGDAAKAVQGSPDDYTRAIQWGKGLRQPQFPQNVYDPMGHNNDDCPLHKVFFQFLLDDITAYPANGIDGGRVPFPANPFTETGAFDDLVKRNPKWCRDGVTAVSGSKDFVQGTATTPPSASGTAVCGAGQQVSACGVHDNLVDFGSSNFMWTFGNQREAETKASIAKSTLHETTFAYNAMPGMRYVRDDDTYAFLPIEAHQLVPGAAVMATADGKSEAERQEIALNAVFGQVDATDTSALGSMASVAAQFASPTVPADLHKYCLGWDGRWYGGDLRPSGSDRTWTDNPTGNTNSWFNVNENPQGLKQEHGWTYHPDRFSWYRTGQNALEGDYEADEQKTANGGFTYYELNARGEHMQAACHDGGPGAVSSMCPYGSHTYACGVRRFSFPVDQAGKDTGSDDSCVDAAGSSLANNGVCEDGLMWSRYPPGKNPCAPGTDTSDCGYRAPRRVARQGIVEEDSCPDAILDADQDKVPVCGDHTDFMGLDVNNELTDISEAGGYNRCGRGADTHRCRKRSANLTTLSTPDDDLWQSRVRHRNSTIDVGASAPGGCSNTCVWPTNAVMRLITGLSGSPVPLPQYRYPSQHSAFFDGKRFDQFRTSSLSNDDDYAGAPLHENQGIVLSSEIPTVCSDGGPGSKRVPFRMPYNVHMRRGSGTAVFDMASWNSEDWGDNRDDDVELGLVYWDFACEYGTQARQRRAPPTHIPEHSESCACLAVRRVRQTAGKRLSSGSRRDSTTHRSRNTRLCPRGRQRAAERL